MQTRTYTDLFDLVQALCGVVFATSEETRIRAFINRRASRAYRSTNYWTRFIVIGEQRTLSNGYVPFTETSLRSIDTFLRIFSARPYGGATYGEYQFTVDPSGAALISGASSPASAFVTYKAQLEDKYGNGTGYVSAIPSEWFEYLAHGAYADYLRAEGQQERAALADQEANEILLDELMKLDEQHTQTIISNRIFTNSNMQPRYGSYSAYGGTDVGESTTPVLSEDGETIITEG
jgi:hypothetical protein